MTRQENNVEIFRDTQDKIKSSNALKASVAKSIAETKFYSESDVILPNNPNSKAGAVEVTGERTFAAAFRLRFEDRTKRIAVHNFASATNPGGGVTKGASAQEECLCRISTLYNVLNTKENWDRFYNPHRAMQNPIYNGDILYTPNIKVIKNDTTMCEMLNDMDWGTFDVITCAAPNLRVNPNNRYNPNPGAKQATLTDKALLEIHKERGRRIMDSALANGADIIVLGAFGCGAFKNNPEAVARAYRELTMEYRDKFDKIVFAVYCTDTHPSNNYAVFNRVVGSLK